MAGHLLQESQTAEYRPWHGTPPFDRPFSFFLFLQKRQGLIRMGFGDFFASMLTSEEESDRMALRDCPFTVAQIDLKCRSHSELLNFHRPIPATSRLPILEQVLPWLRYEN